jgi:hypothetical protein
MAPRKPDLHWIEKALDGRCPAGQPMDEDRDRRLFVRRQITQSAGLIGVTGKGHLAARQLVLDRANRDAAH